MKYYKKHILSFYEKCSDTDIEDNRYWYHEANSFVEKTATENDLNVATVAGILSAISPGVKWGQNKLDTKAFLGQHRELSYVPKGICTTYYRNVSKALKIAQEDDAEIIYRILLGKRNRGNKTANFFMNILYPEYPQYVTIDRHSYRVAIGAKREHGTITVNIREYRRIALAYQKTSKETPLTAPELQAVTWCKYINQSEAPF